MLSAKQCGRDRIEAFSALLITLATLTAAWLRRSEFQHR